MTHRVRKIRSDYDDHYYERPLMPDLIVDDREPIDRFTGLLDADGNKIVYTIYPEPIGFLWHDEEGVLKQRSCFETEEPS